MKLIEQALLDVSVSWQARTLYAFMLARRYERPIIKAISAETGMTARRVSMLLSELMSKGWLLRRQAKHGSRAVSYTFHYRGHPALRPYPEEGRGCSQ